MASASWQPFGLGRNIFNNQFNQSIKSSFVKGAGAHPQNAPCRRRSHALRKAPVRRGRLLFFTDDLHDNLSWVPASDKPHTFKSCFTHSSQVFFSRPGPFLPGTGLDLTLFISPLERMTCPNHLSRRSRTRMARSHIPSLACSSSIDGSSDGLTPQIQRIIARSFNLHINCLLKVHILTNVHSSIATWYYDHKVP